MNLNIPKSQFDDVAALLTSPPDKLRALNEALAHAVPKMDIEEFATQLGASGIPFRELQDIIELLIVWCMVRADLEMSVPKLLDELQAAGERSDDPRLKSGWTSVRSELERALSAKPIVIVAKARDVGTTFLRTFHRARIISDVRPIFSDVDQAPEGFVIAHTLQLSASESSDEKDWYVTLDLADLRQMKETVERAIKKHETLKHFLASASANVFE